MSISMSDIRAQLVVLQALAITGCQQTMCLARRYEGYHRHRAASDR